MPLTKLVKQCAEETKWVSEFESEEYQKGRTEKRIVNVYEPSKKMSDDWPQIKKVITVRRVRMIKGTTSDKTHYYISSLKSNHAEIFHQIIRSHWYVENKLHWVKDAVMHEDSTRLHSYKSMKMNALYRNFAICCLKLQKITSVKTGLELIRWNPKKVIKLMRT